MWTASLGNSSRVKISKDSGRDVLDVAVILSWGCKVSEMVATGERIKQGGLLIYGGDGEGL